jgi:hypothetical protein
VSVDGERVEREPTGGLGAEPPVGSRGKAPGGGSGGLRPPEAGDLCTSYKQNLTLKLI